MSRESKANPAVTSPQLVPNPPLDATAVILAAGKGTRMKSSLPKVLHSICGKPLLAYVVDSAFQAGVESCVVVKGHEAKQVRESLLGRYQAKEADSGESVDARIRFALQKEQRGTGDAVAAAAKLLSGGARNVLVLSGDVPLVQADTLKKLLSLREERKAPVVLASIELENPTGYGRLLRNESGQVQGIVEEKDASETQRTIREVNAGIYCFERNFLLENLPRLSPKNAQGEYYLTDLVALAAAQGLPVLSVNTAAEEAEGVNDRLQLSRLETLLRQRINEKHMRNGVTLRDPGSTWIDVEVELESDVEIEPAVSLRGKTRVAEGSRIGQGCVVINSTIGPRVELRPYTHVEGSRIEAGSGVGPFARLRPGTELGEEVHIGNFVETKKARFGARSKASHLSYLGDAILGSDCNIGAGTITCNYDGKNKFNTRLGNGVFVGSDSQLIAPVTLGDGAYVGAGSTVTKDVPADALVVTRAPTTLRPGWAARKREAEQSTQEEQVPPKKAAPGQAD